MTDSKSGRGLAHRLPDKIDLGTVVLRPSNLLTAREDPTVNRVTFLSRPAEHHAAGVGFVVGVVGIVSVVLGVPPEAAVGVLLAGTAGLGGWSGRKAMQTLLATGHVRDSVREPAYAFFGLLVSVFPTLLWLFRSGVTA